MKKSITILCILTSFLSYRLLVGEHTVTLFIQPDPSIELAKAAESLEKKAATMETKLAKPGKIAKVSLKSILPKEPINAGIFSTYAGYITASDLHGQITFPRWHDEPLFYLLITPAIQPVFMSSNTIAHWEILTTDPDKTMLYRFERKVETKEKPEKIEAYYWETTEVPLPNNNRIPYETIVIFAKAKHFYLPSLEGVVPTNNNPNLILPTVYITKQALTLNESLLVMTIRQFFSGITKQYKQEAMRRMEQIELMRKI